MLGLKTFLVLPSRPQANEGLAQVYTGIDLWGFLAMSLGMEGKKERFYRPLIKRGTFLLVTRDQAICMDNMYGARLCPWWDTKNPSCESKTTNENHLKPCQFLSTKRRKIISYRLLNTGSVR